MKEGQPKKISNAEVPEMKGGFEIEEIKMDKEDVVLNENKESKEKIQENQDEEKEQKKEAVKEGIEKTKEIKAEIAEKSKQIDQLKDQYKNKSFWQQAKGLFGRSEKKESTELQEQIRGLQKERMNLVLERVDKQKENATDEVKENLEKRKERTARATAGVIEKQEEKDQERKFEGKNKELISKISETKLASWYLKQPRVTKMAISAGVVSVFLPGAFVANFGSRIMGAVVGTGAGMLGGKLVERRYNKKIEKKQKADKLYEKEIFKGTAEERLDLILNKKEELKSLEKRKLYVTMGVTAIATILTSMEARGQVAENVFDQNPTHQGSYALDYINKLTGIDLSEVDYGKGLRSVLGIAEENEGENALLAGKVGAKISENPLEKEFEIKGVNDPETLKKINPNYDVEAPLKPEVGVQQTQELENIYTVKKDDTLWEILENNDKFWEQNGWQDLTDSQKERVIYDIVQDLEKNKGLMDKFVNINPGDKLDLQELQEYVDNRPEMKIESIITESAGASESLDGAVNKSSVSEVQLNLSEYTSYSEVKNNFYSAVEEKFPNGQYEIQLGDTTWDIVKERLLKETLHLDDTMSEDKLNNLTANILSRLREEIRANGGSLKEQWGCNLSFIQAGDKINVKEFLRIIENNKVQINGQRLNLFDRALVYEKPEKLAGGYMNFDDCEGKPCGERIPKQHFKPAVKQAMRTVVVNDVPKFAHSQPVSHQNFSRAEMEAMGYDQSMTYEETGVRIVPAEETREVSNSKGEYDPCDPRLPLSVRIANGCQGSEGGGGGRGSSGGNDRGPAGGGTSDGNSNDRGPAGGGPSDQKS
ncbi:hypothetical protein CSB11_03060 [Candidatus Campbellbacteria bacterium]|nr:MAG: hypothetical protein CSB11_03060 [Candidatus Campbellbacteria bacterium]